METWCKIPADVTDVYGCDIRRDVGHGLGE